MTTFASAPETPPPGLVPDGPRTTDELIAERLGRDLGGRGSPPGRSVVAWGCSPRFLTITEDVARAADLAFRRAGGEHPLRCGPDDVLVIQAESVPEVVHVAEGRVEVREPGPPAVVAGMSGGEDPWKAAGVLGGVWKQPDVVILPQGRSWLADHVARPLVADMTHPRVGVLGATGGIGTSTLSLWLAARLREDGHETVVVDAVPSGVGMDSCLTPDRHEGLRWHQLMALPRRPEPAHLLASLPAPHGLPVLTWETDRWTPDSFTESGRWDVGEALSTVAVPVVDLGSVASVCPEGQDEGPWISRCSVLVLLVPFTVRGICQAKSVVRRWSSVLPVIPVGVGPRICDVSRVEAGAAVTEPLRAVVPHVPSAYGAYDDGAILSVGYRRPVRRAVADLARAVEETCGMGPDAGARS